jgi:outer membrane protein OmpA-like peptidoglycan-associated protein/polyisoprenoid-binding protein YceI
MRVRLLLPIAALALLATPAIAQEWLLNAKASTFYMQTAKANAVIETHQFTGLDGAVHPNGDASVKIDLTSVLSGIDLRDVRMRFLLFETYKFANADISAKLDMTKLQQLQQTARVTYPLKFTLNLHGVTKEMEATVNVTRVSDKSISVVTAKPIIIMAESFNLTAGIAKLSEAIAGVPIVPAASFTFDLLFETGEKLPEIQTARAEATQRKIETETAPISAEACETRFKVISTTGAVYFKTGSAELDASSDPLLASVVDIANRCPSMRIEVSGHTDNVGNRNANQSLSEQRAKSVANFMTQRGVNASRIVTAGFGGSRPVAQNSNEAGRSKNRRIEFRVLQR